MESENFAGFLSAVASRLRHDLKGGLITLRMGLEALPDDEDLKPLLVERARHLETLSDKLVLLLRMGEMRPEPMRLSALLGEFRNRAAERFPGLQLEFPSDLGEARPLVDGDALLYALTELAENAALAGAKRLRLTAKLEPLILTLRDDGKGASIDDLVDLHGNLAGVGASRWGRSGLGLAIVERCAMGHGGDLRLSAAEPTGMEVSVRLSAVDPMNPIIDQQLLRQTLGQFATGITVISFVREGEICGMTVNSFSSVSLDPPMVLFCPALTTRFALEAEMGEDFTVSILSREQREICTHFAGRPLLAKEPWPAGEVAPPPLEGCLAWLRCRTCAIHTHGDHLVVVGEVHEFASHSDGDPLLFFRGAYPMLES